MGTARPKTPMEILTTLVSVARRLECDEDKGRFEEKLKRIATAKPLKPKQKDR
jgi:hypothetical protein